MRVKLTTQQAEQVDWALGPMNDFWTSEIGDHNEDGRVYTEQELPMLVACSKNKATWYLTLSPIEEINEDLLYRLETQLQQMSDREIKLGTAEATAAKTSAKAAKNAAYRIRRAMQHDNSGKC